MCVQRQFFANYACLIVASGNSELIHGIADSKSAVRALSPKVWLTCIYKSTLPGPKTKLPPS